MLLTLSGRSFIKIQYSSFPLFPVAYPFRIATQLQYYVKREKCKVNDIIFPYGCEARAINLGNKNVTIGIFTGGTSVRSKNIFTDISLYPTGKHEILRYLNCGIVYMVLDLQRPVPGSVSTILKNILCPILQIFLYLAAFECNINSDWLTIRFSQSEALLHSNLQNVGGKKKNVLGNGW